MTPAAIPALVAALYPDIFYRTVLVQHHDEAALDWHHEATIGRP